MPAESGAMRVGAWAVLVRPGDEAGTELLPLRAIARRAGVRSCTGWLDSAMDSEGVASDSTREREPSGPAQRT